MASREERWAAIEDARHLVESGVIPSRAYTVMTTDVTAAKSTTLTIPNQATEPPSKAQETAADGRRHS